MVCEKTKTREAMPLLCHMDIDNEASEVVTASAIINFLLPPLEFRMDLGMPFSLDNCLQARICST